LGGCLFDEAMLPETLHFLRNPHHHGGKPAKLYGTEACAQGELAGHSCLIFPPNRPTSKAVIISGQRVKEIQVTARDPQNPISSWSTTRAAACWHHRQPRRHGEYPDHLLSSHGRSAGAHASSTT
jgi:hypothetical protein